MHKRIAMRAAAVAVGAAGAVGLASVPAFAASQVGPGSTGAAVKCVQRAMNYLDNAGLSVDGDYGSLTTAAVETYQRDHSLSADGIVGPDTGTSIKETIVYVIEIANKDGQSADAAAGNAWLTDCNSLIEGTE
jgi:peptidoglycan hydrolase-like protein with peptidoglycan-binding domain